jgi:hypothetical protein
MKRILSFILAAALLAAARIKDKSLFMSSP